MHVRLFVVAAALAATAAPAWSQAPPADAAPPAIEQPRRPRDRPRRRPADSLVLVTDVVYATLPGDGDEPRELVLDAAFAKHGDGSPMPAVVYIHGGGWRGGDKAQGLGLVEALASGGYFAVTIEHRLSDEAPYPAALHDCKAAVRFLRANADELGIDAQRIGVIGHSSGGHLAALVGTSGNVPDLEGRIGTMDVPSAVAVVVTLAAPTDLLALAEGAARAADAAPEGLRTIELFLGGPLAQHESVAREASPVTHVDATDPPFLIVHGQRDRVVPVSQARGLRDALTAAGVDARLELLRGANHRLPDRRIALLVARFLDEHLGGHAAPLFQDTPPPDP